MELGRRFFQAFGPVVVGASLLALPLLFAPDRARAASTSDCAGYDTVECQTLEACIGIEWLGFQFCQTNTTYWPPVVTILEETVDDLFMEIDYEYDYAYGDGGGEGF